MNCRVAAFILACSALPGQQIYDLLLKNGRVIDPANRRDARLDVAVIGNRIVKVAPDLPAADARVAVEVGGYMIAPGLIDIDTHLGPQLKPDYNTLPYGVTTVVDAAATGCQTYHAKVRVLAFSAVACPSQNQETIAGSAPAPSLLRFQIAQEAIARKNLPETISSGMDWNSVLIPRTNLSTAMSIYLNLGMTAEQIIERVTSNAARAIKRPQLGTLSEGAEADIAVLEIKNGKFGFLDSARTRLDATRRFRCLLTVRSGVIVWDSEGLSIPDTVKAGPYTNFK